MLCELARDESALMRVTLNDLSRLPVDRLARLLLEWAAEDHSLLGRLHATLQDPANVVVPPAPPTPDNTRWEIIGRSAPLQHVVQMLERYATTDEPVLITGESGTGKELAARAIHETSRRHAGPFVAMNCAAIPSNLVASELFGYEKGAFTGAAARTRGQIEHATGGTLFLDEIGDMPVDLQGHLLRFLQEGQIVRVGGREAINVDVRVIAATNVRLPQAITDGRFREDLYYRLNVLTVRMPPLRERSEDIEPLARHFLRQAAAQFGRDGADFTPDAIEALRRFGWPGNVRELMSVVRRTVIISNSAVLAAADLIGLDAPSLAPAAVSVPLKPQPGSEAERAALLNALARTQENVSLTAQQLGVSRVTLYRMLHRHAIVLDRGLKSAPGAGRQAV
jgi:transcriptional regulator with PAS, ATPase and Fis domain